MGAARTGRTILHSNLMRNIPMPGKSLPVLDEPKAGRLTIQYAPDTASEIVENPPRFTWLPVIEDEAQYVLRISADPTFPAKIHTGFQWDPAEFLHPRHSLCTGGISLVLRELRPCIGCCRQRVEQDA